MRRALVVFLLVNILIIAFLIHSCFTLLTLLIEDGAKDAIQPAEIPAPKSPLIDTRPQLIPKIIHQTYINESIPAKWREAQQSCVDMHEDYEYKVSRIPAPTTDRAQLAGEEVWSKADRPPQQLWTDAGSRDFVAKEYPWFLDSFDNYHFPIQRADAIRYFVLAHFGGIYIDLDDVSLPPLTFCPSLTHKLT